MRLRHILAFVCLSLFGIAQLYAQSPNGTISGLVVDPTGAIVIGADVLAANDATGVQYPVKTNQDGIYLVSSLPPGTYRLQVSKVGFKTLIKPDIVLNVQDALAINFTLPVGAISEIVTVTAGAPIVNTTDGSVSTIVDQNYVKNMPLNGRSFQDLILLTPGTVTQTPQNSFSSQLGETGEFSVNGQRTESNYYTVDGVSANAGAAPGVLMLSQAGGSGSVPLASALGTTQALVSVDDLQEFRVQSSTYSAEYGRNPGGQFAFETKSGTNQWHGTAYDYLRNGAFDANDWFNNYLGVKQLDLRQNDFGGTLGGPVEIPGLYNGKDRTFFFVSYEGLRLIQPQEATVNYVPDETLRSSAPAPLQPVLNAFPIANGADVGNGLAEFISSWSNPSSLDSTSVRFDHVVNDRFRLFFRFSDTPSEVHARGNGVLATPSMEKTLNYLSRTYTGGVNTVITNHVSNEFRLNYTSNQVVSRTVIGAFGGNTPIDFAATSGLNSTAQIDALLLYGGYEVGINQGNSSGLQKQWNLVDTASLSEGRHEFKFGVDYRRLAPVSLPFSPLVEYLYESESGVESNSSLGIAANYVAVYPLFHNFSAFVQDDWRVSPRLNVSLGLRWELNPAPGVTQGLKPYTVEGLTPSTWTLAPQGAPLWKTSWYNFAPRLGLAYVVRNTSGWETVIRGGAGIFYDTAQQLSTTGIQGPGFSLHHAWLSYKHKFHLHFTDVLEPPNAPVILGGWRLSNKEARVLQYEFERATDKLNAAAARVNADMPWKSPKARVLDKTSLREAVEEIKDASGLCKLAILEQLVTDNGVPAEGQSYLGVLAMINGGGGKSYWEDTEVFRCKEGNQKLAERLADSLPDGSVHLNCKVKRIRIRDGEVQVWTSKGTKLIARDLILAVPPSVWPSIRFDPGLPKRYFGQFGRNVKYLMNVEKNSWSPLSPSLSSDGPIDLTWQGTDQQPGPRAALVAFSGANDAEQCRGWKRREDEYLSRLAPVYPEIGRRIKKCKFMDWPGNKWTRGSYSFPAPGEVMRVGPLLRKPFHRRMHFAGEHTCYAFVGYMEGALQSGLRVAEQLARRDRVI